MGHRSSVTLFPDARLGNTFLVVPTRLRICFFFACQEFSQPRAAVQKFLTSVVHFAIVLFCLRDYLWLISKTYSVNDLLRSMVYTHSSGSKVIYILDFFITKTKANRTKNLF